MNKLKDRELPEWLQRMLEDADDDEIRRNREEHQAALRRADRIKIALLASIASAVLILAWRAWQ